MPTTHIIDDKSPVCVPFILERLRQHQQSQSHGKTQLRPFFIGLNGVQGVGKTTLVRALELELRNEQHLETLVCSIDDFYLRHEDQLALASAHPGNLLVQCRGEPGTHDVKLLSQVFTSLRQNSPAKIPRYNKAAFSGQGDREPESSWTLVNADPETSKPIQVVILEGWCVGFRPLSPSAVKARWQDPTARTLQHHKLEDLLFVNDQLARYDVVTDLLDAFVHIDAAETVWVYDWRWEQEAALREEKGTGMTDEQVRKFVDAYYPAYELYSDSMRDGVLAGRRPGCQLRLTVGKDRRVQSTATI